MTVSSEKEVQHPSCCCSRSYVSAPLTYIWDGFSVKRASGGNSFCFQNLKSRSLNLGSVDFLFHCSRFYGGGFFGGGRMSSLGFFCYLEENFF